MEEKDTPSFKTSSLKHSPFFNTSTSSIITSNTFPPTSSNVAQNYSILSQLSALPSELKSAVTYVFHTSSKAREDARMRLLPETNWLLKTTLSAASFGFVTGGYLAGQQRGRQFLAENAHRLPKTVGGWYFYHKYKNYEMAMAAFMGGLKHAKRFWLISAGFTSTELIIEHWHGQESWINSLASGCTLAIGFSIASQ